MLSRSDILKRHIDKFCKVKKLQEEEKENILEMLIEKDKEKQIETQNKKILDLQKTIDVLNQKIDKQLTKAKTINKNKGIINNIIIPEYKLVNFGSEDVSKIPKETLRKIVGQSGFPALVGCFNALHNNKDYPQGMNGYVSDKSRDKGMIWKDGKWQQTTPKRMFLTCMNKIDSYIQHCKIQIESGVYNTKKDPNGDILLDMLENRVELYYNRYLGEDKTVSEKTCHDFEKLVKHNIINELCNIKHNVIYNYEKLLEEMENNDKLQNKQEKINNSKDAMNRLIDKINDIDKKIEKKIKKVIIDDNLNSESEF